MAAAKAPMRCHYEVIGVEQTATEDEIRRAFRKKALAIHPDKHPDEREFYTIEFQLLQAAHAVLSDPQERAWYDNHRDAILRGGTVGDGEGSEGIDVTPYFSSSAFSGYDDNERGFYKVFAKVFQDIWDDEARERGASTAQMPSFGSANSDYEKVVRPFYEHWMSFATSHQFYSSDKWDLRQAEQRYARRAMEKENKKERETARRQYNLDIRAFVSFVRKRDKRILQYQIQQKEKQEAADKAKVESKKEQIARYAEIRKTMEAELRQQKDRPADDDDDDDEEEEEVLEFECVACDKTFKSEKSWESHQKSKKHLKAVAQLKLELEAEDELFQTQSPPAGEEVPEGDELAEHFPTFDPADLATDELAGEDNSTGAQSDDSADREGEEGEDDEEVEEGSSPAAAKKPQSKRGFQATTTATSSEDSGDDDIDSLSHLVKQMMNKKKQAVGKPAETPDPRADEPEEAPLAPSGLREQQAAESSDDSEEESAPVNKAKLKRQKRQAKKEKELAAEQDKKKKATPATSSQAPPQASAPAPVKVKIPKSQLKQQELLAQADTGALSDEEKRVKKKKGKSKS
eukprot:m.61999 g.61999  ORF g.61999 m.61999 type:complete len:574 (+) comp49514_c0_seq3:160-1881(+)